VEWALLSPVIANDVIMGSVELLIILGGVLLMFGVVHGLYRLGGSMPNPAGMGMAVNLSNLSKDLEQEALKAEDVLSVSSKKQSESSEQRQTSVGSTIGNFLGTMFGRFIPSSSSSSSNTPSYEAK
jgi:hypothetical protein